MRKKIICLFMVALGYVMMGAMGCGTMQSARISQLQDEVFQKNQEISALKSNINELEATVAQNEMEIIRSEKANQELRAVKESFESELQESRMREEEAMREVAAADERTAEMCTLFPMKAKAGECYAKVFIPAKYKTVSEKVLKQEASEKIEIIPARYEWVTEKVLEKEATRKFVEVPARYEWVEEKVLEKEAHQVWKKGRGPIEKVDNSTGEIMCLVEIPASYTTLKKQVLKEAARVDEIEIPATYKTVKVMREIQPAQTRRVPIPARYQTVCKTVKVEDEHMEWRRILCETNVTPDLVAGLQEALLNAGHDPGPIDGIIGPRTNAAIGSYQKAKGLASGALTYETLESLNVR